MQYGKIKSIALVALCALFTFDSKHAIADKAAADRCASDLSKPGARIYEITAPDIGKETVISDALKRRVRPLVVNGEIDRATAEKSAQSAGACLDLLRR